MRHCSLGQHNPTLLPAKGFSENMMLVPMLLIS